MLRYGRRKRGVKTILGRGKLLVLNKHFYYGVHGFPGGLWIGLRGSINLGRKKMLKFSISFHYECKEQTTV